MVQNIKGLKESIVKSLFELHTRQFQKKQSQQTNTYVFVLQDLLVIQVSARTFL